MLPASLRYSAEEGKGAKDSTAQKDKSSGVAKSLAPRCLSVCLHDLCVTHAPLLGYLHERVRLVGEYG